MKIILAVALSIFSVSSFANQKSHLSLKTQKQLTISSVEVLDLTESYINNVETAVNMSQTFSALDGIGSIGGKLDQVNIALDKADLIVDKVINIGQKIWNVVEKGRPVSNYSNLKATALPGNTTSWQQLENWKMPKSKVVGVVYKNVYGIEVVRFVYRIVLLYGGSVNGVGKYIGYASVEPLEMSTAYMFNFNAQAKVETVFNMGTKQDPLAGMILNISWTVKTVLQSKTLTHTYNLDGLGNIVVPAN